MDTAQIRALVPRLADVEHDIQRLRFDLNRLLREDAACTEATAVHTAPAAAEPPPAAPESAKPKPTRSPISYESFVGGRALNWAGLMLLFLGTAFFLKVAFDHNWIGPAMRVALGTISGAVLIAFAQYVAARGQRYFAEGLVALGAAIEYVSLFAANSLFHILPAWGVFAGMIAVTALLAVLARRSTSIRLGALTAIGGFLTPMLAGGSSDDRVMLALYLCALDGGLLLLGELLDTPWLGAAALGATGIYWLADFSTATTLTDTTRATLGAAFYGVFTAASFAIMHVRKRLNPVRLSIGAATLGGFMLVLETTFGGAHRPALALSLFALAAVHLGAGALLKSRFHSWLAVGALTAALPAALGDFGTNVAFAIEAAALVALSIRNEDVVLRCAGALILIADAIRALALYPGFESTTLLLNARDGSLMVLAAAILFSTRAIARSAFDEHSIERLGIPYARIGAHALMLWAFCAEAWDAAAHITSAVYLAQAQNVAISIVIALFAAVCVALGLLKKDALLRWEGLALLCVAAAKVLLFDLAWLEVAYRVVSTLGVGALLLGVSYAYQLRLGKSQAAQQ